MTTACPRCGFPETAPKIAAVWPTSLSPELRRSNTAPLESQSIEFIQQMGVATTAISEIEDKMQDLQRALDDLVVQQQALLNFVAEHQKVLATVRTLPNELLVEIFLRCADRDSSCEWNPDIDPEWVLGRVCSRWRTVALSTPQIWSRIFISNGPFWQQFESRGLSVKPNFSRQMERSAEAPLTITFDVETHFPDEVAENMLTLLLSAAHRWQQANICLMRPGGRLLQPISATSFPQLRALFLKHGYSRNLQSTSNPCAIFQSAPLLEDLGFSGHSYNHRPWPLARIHVFPLSQIQRLTLKQYQYQISEFLDVIRSANDIVELSVEQWLERGEDPNASLDYTPVTLASLRTLSLVDAETSFLRFMVVPAVQHLTLDLMDYSLNEIAEFLPYTQSSLTRLTLITRPIHSAERLLQALNLTPGITHLTLVGGFRLDSGFIRALSCGPGERNLVPGVVTLEIGGSSYCDRASFFNMLKSRCAPGPLRSVTLRGWLNNLSDPLEFEALRQDHGLNIHLNP
ncbi:hypothetical protein B0H16DRAFT_1563092 [Mycena metata]|uniref:F-box domain-containing protein n=1 Tax=Mycena metata TaxID=1033252 RepID=A0AAD7IIE3_9AGAR|nr:hypothetical protein B0H16DRAFT_1563092 [Mycena metata]